MATHSSICACKVPWTEEPAGLWSLGSQRIGHNQTIEHSEHNHQLDTKPFGGTVMSNLTRLIYIPQNSLPCTFLVTRAIAD